MVVCHFWFLLPMALFAALGSPLYIEFRGCYEIAVALPPLP